MSNYAFAEPSINPSVPSPPHQSPPRLTQRTRNSLLGFYDYPHPMKPGKIIRGYDKAHARRTAKLCVMVAEKLQHPSEQIRQYEIACLLHDLGRAGLDQQLFGKIWSWAKTQNIPTRPREWRKAYPHTSYGKETEAFLELYGKDLQGQGIPLNSWTRAQIEMRLGFARRLRKRIREVKPRLHAMGITWVPWMEQIMLYYYYPEKLKRASRWVLQLAEILVACEQLEAYNNHRRGRDYYTRSRESLPQAFQYLEQLRLEKIISQEVFTSIVHLMNSTSFTKILIEARRAVFTPREQRFLQTLQKDFA